MNLANKFKRVGVPPCESLADWWLVRKWRLCLGERSTTTKYLTQVVGVRVSLWTSVRVCVFCVGYVCCSKCYFSKGLDTKRPLNDERLGRFAELNHCQFYGPRRWRGIFLMPRHVTEGEVSSKQKQLRLQGPESLSPLTVVIIHGNNNNNLSLK